MSLPDEAVLALLEAVRELPGAVLPAPEALRASVPEHVERVVRDLRETATLTVCPKCRDALAHVLGAADALHIAQRTIRLGRRRAAAHANDGAGASYVAQAGAFARGILELWAGLAGYCDACLPAAVEAGLASIAKSHAPAGGEDAAEKRPHA